MVLLNVLVYFCPLIVLSTHLGTAGVGVRARVWDGRGCSPVPSSAPCTIVQGGAAAVSLRVGCMILQLPQSVIHADPDFVVLGGPRVVQVRPCVVLCGCYVDSPIQSRLKPWQGRC